MYIRCDNLRNDFEQPIRKGDRDNIEKNYGEAERLLNLCKISEKADEAKKIIAEHPSKIINVDNEYTSIPSPSSIPSQTTETFSTIENNKVRQIVMRLLKIILVFYILCVIFSKKAKNIIKIIKKHLNFKK